MLKIATATIMEMYDMADSLLDDCAELLDELGREVFDDYRLSDSAKQGYYAYRDDRMRSANSDLKGYLQFIDKVKTFRFIDADKGYHYSFDFGTYNVQRQLGSNPDHVTVGFKRFAYNYEYLGHKISKTFSVPHPRLEYCED